MQLGAETVTAAKRRASTNVTIVELGIVFVEQVVGMVVAELVDALLELLLNTSARGSHSIRTPRVYCRERYTSCVARASDTGTASS